MWKVLPSFQGEERAVENGVTECKNNPIYTSIFNSDKFLFFKKEREKDQKSLTRNPNRKMSRRISKKLFDSSCGTTPATILITIVGKEDALDYLQLKALLSVSVCYHKLSLQRAFHWDELVRYAQLRSCKNPQKKAMDLGVHSCWLGICVSFNTVKFKVVFIGFTVP